MSWFSRHRWPQVDQSTEEDHEIKHHGWRMKWPEETAAFATQTSPGDTPTQILSTAGIIVPVYVWQSQERTNTKEPRWNFYFFILFLFLNIILGSFFASIDLEFNRLHLEIKMPHLGQIPYAENVISLFALINPLSFLRHVYIFVQDRRLRAVGYPAQGKSISQ